MDIATQSQILKTIQHKAESISVLLESLIADKYNRKDLIDGYEFILNVLRQLPMETIQKKQLNGICSNIFRGEMENMMNSIKKCNQQQQSEEKEEVLEKKKESPPKNSEPVKKNQESTPKNSEPVKKKKESPPKNSEPDKKQELKKKNSEILKVPIQKTGKTQAI